ncbi:glycosyltransferase family 8 protein [Companilactobacillus jidongensis]|uniref:glycosyltransferase family 8 protein n=1 Tax=Companilactobacillus jidongensis TaxID=2486006 RepID=UPI000F7A6B14|nr:glycosyltransferase family 8 protein [Companilactobacillus jidongensis]
MNRLSIFYCIDDKYAPYAATSLESLKENTSSKVQVTILFETLSKENIQKLNKIQNNNLNIKFYELAEGFSKLFDNDKNILRADYSTMTIYYRIFIADFFPDIDKAIYIDADTIIDSDITDLFNTDLNNNLLGAVPDSFICNDQDARKYASDAISVLQDKYINSGVLLMNLKLMRELVFGRHFVDVLNKYHFELIAPDQDYINVICKDCLQIIDYMWNVQTEFILDNYVQPKIVHYNLFGKPWNYDDVSFGDLFWEYAIRTDYYDEIESIKDSYSDKDKNMDALHKKSLIEKIKKIPNNSLTFKSVEDSGMKICL